MSQQLLITGATGSTGAAVLRHALAEAPQETEIRVGVRKSGGPGRWPVGVREVVADFDQPDSIAAALAGIQRAYLVTPSSESAQAQQIGFVEQAAAAGVERVVLLSQLGARIDSPVRFLRYHAAVEQRIAELGLGYTFLRPNLFFQGLLAMAPYVAQTQTLVAPIGDAKVSAVDIDDIGAVGARALLSDEHDGATYTITGPAAITHAEMAADLSRATGRTISFVDAEPDAFAEVVSAALPPWQVAGLLEDYAHYRRGEAAEVSGAVEQVTGRAPRAFADFAATYGPAFVS